MKIIILEGDKTKGKTTTMGVVFVALHENGGKVNNFIPMVSAAGGMDFEAVFDYPDTANEKKTLKVAIYSEGDNIAHCNATIQKYSQQNMDVLIIAYSIKQTRLTIPQKDKDVRVQKTVAAPTKSEVKANIKDCRKIISLI